MAADIRRMHSRKLDCDVEFTVETIFPQVRAMSEQPQKFRRSKIYVDKDVQKALLHQLVMQWVAVFSIMFVILVLAEVLKSGFSLDFAGAFLSALRKNTALFVAILVMSPCIVYQLIRLSHRFVGPMVSFRRSLCDLAEGKEVEPLYFRKNDFWCDIAENFNTILETVQQSESGRPVSDEQPEEVAV